MKTLLNSFVRGLALAGLLVSLASCSHKSQSDQLASLDEAYKSGVFSKEEYEAKKAALAGTPAATAPQPASVAAQPPAPEPIASSASGAPEPAPAAKEVEPAEPEPAPLKECQDAEWARKDEGPPSRFFPMPVARVKKAALDALRVLDFDIHRDEPNEIEASKRRHISAIVGAGGERELLQFKDAQQGGEPGTRVTGETKKSAVGKRLAQKTWTAAVLAQIACNLK